MAASLPEPVPGLVFRYDYLRPRHHDEGVENPKERPACILLVLKAGEVLSGATLIDEMSGRNVVDYTASEGDAVIFRIQTDPPDANQLGIELTLDTKAYVGLPGDKPSWAIISEVNIDRWPNSGLGRVPGTGAFAYRRHLPGPVMAAIAKTFLKLRERRLVRGLTRHP